MLAFDWAPRIETTTERILVGTRIAERARHVAHRRPGAICDHVGNLCGMHAPVTLVHVLNDFFAPIAFDVQIDIGRAITLGRQEPLEQQPE